MDETEIPWMLAEKLIEKGFPNLYDYFSTAFYDPETGKKPENTAEFSLYALKMMTAPLRDGKKDVGGDKINGWEEYKKRGTWNSSPYAYKSRWGKFKTKTKKFEFYSETPKDALAKHADKHKTTIDDILAVCNYTARGEKAFVPHYEEPFRYGDPKEYPFDLIDFKSKLNREGRSANCTWYHEFKKVDIGDSSREDVIQINPQDASRNRDTTVLIKNCTSSGKEVAQRIGDTPPYRHCYKHSDCMDVRKPGIVEKCLFWSRRVHNGERPCCVETGGRNRTQCLLYS